MTLYLLPNLLGEQREFKEWIPPILSTVVSTLDGLIAESPQGGRSFLNHFQTKKPPYSVPLAVLTKHTTDEEIDFFLSPVKKGENWGVISDAGTVAIADPGSKLIFRAGQLGIKVKTLEGFSSLWMAIQLSGLYAQHFSFLGYLAQEPEARAKEIALLEKRSFQENSLQFFIEAPYRNMATLQSLLATLKEETYLSLVIDLTLPTETVLCKKVSAWKKSPLPRLEKRAAVFLVRAKL